MSILPVVLKTGDINWKLFVLNITTLFGFIKPTAYFSTGAWSIGNEMVYYALTPLIFYLYNYKKIVGNIFFVITFCIGLFFAFKLLDPKISLADQWALYVNPFNNLFLYVMGIATYYNFRDIGLNSKFNNILLIAAILLFGLLPFSGNQISIASGIGRVVFVILSFIIVFCFYKFRIKLPKLIGNTLEKFGIATYGVYLFHPIVYIYSSYLFRKIDLNCHFIIFSFVFIVTILLSITSYRIFELRFIKIGKKLTSTTS